MTWQTFFAADDGFGPLLEGMLRIQDSRLFEVYGFAGVDARSFTSAAEAASILALGTDSGGHGVAVHCALWVPAVMPAPARRRIELSAGSWRETIEGCGLFWLHAGGRSEQSVTESTLGWFTEGRLAKSAQPSLAQIKWIGRHTGVWPRRLPAFSASKEWPARAAFRCSLEPWSCTGRDFDFYTAPGSNARQKCKRPNPIKRESVKRMQFARAVSVAHRVQLHALRYYSQWRQTVEIAATVSA